MEGFTLDATATKTTCTGLAFRGYKSTFYSNGRVETRQGVRMLKSRSCLCDRCMSLISELGEAVAADYLIMPDIEHGKLYSLCVDIISTDWETGFVESWNLKFYPLED